MNYRGYFRNTTNVKYVVDIITDEKSTTFQEITLADDPFVTESKIDDEYAPIMCTTGTVRIVTKQPLFDIYNSEAQAVRCDVYEELSNKYVFRGFVSPNCYNQDFNSLVDEMEINVIDGLSTLQYIEYEQKDKDNKKLGTIKFIDLILDALRKCKTYDTLYITKAKQFDENDKTFILDHLACFEQNFFEDDDEHTPLKYSEILEEVLKYLNYTMINNENIIYIVDNQEIIENNRKTFVEYTSKNSLFDTVNYSKLIVLQYNIRDNLFSGSGANLSLSDTYNQVAKEISIYNNDEFIPEITDIDTKKLSTNVTGIVNPYGVKEESFNIKSKTFRAQYWHNKNFNYHFRLLDGYGVEGEGQDIISPTEINNEILKNYCTSFILNQMSFEDAKESVGKSYEQVFAMKEPMDIETYNPTIYNGIFRDYHILESSSIPYNVLSSNKKTKMMILIKGECMKQTGVGLPIVLDDGGKGENDYFNQVPYINVGIRIGNYVYKHVRKDHTTFNLMRDHYPTGDNDYEVFTDYAGAQTTAGWVKADDAYGESLNDYCEIKFGSESDKYVYNEWKPIQENVWNANYWNERGFGIEIPEYLPLSGDLHFYLYLSPQNIYPSDHKRPVFAEYTFLKNFEVKLVISEKKDGSDEYDIKYVNVINDNFVNDKGADTLKVNTFTPNGLSWSYVLKEKKDNTGVWTGEYEYLTELYDAVTKQTEMPEKLAIMEQVNQFKVPRIIYNLELSSVLNLYNRIEFQNDPFINKLTRAENTTKFLITSRTRNYRYKTDELSLVERRKYGI